MNKRSFPYSLYSFTISAIPNRQENDMKYPTEVDFQDLNKFQNITITECGEENLYFTHEDKKYFCKCL